MSSELSLVYRRRRTWALLGALAGIPLLLAVAVRLSAGQPAPGEGPPLLDRITNNGLFVGVTATVLSVPLFLPLTVSVVAGDMVAGESNMGTLRYLLVAPAGRGRLLATKFTVALSFCLAAALTLALVGAAFGALLFPVGPVTLLSGSTASIGESFLRALAVAGFAAVSLVGLTAIGLFISTLTDVPVGAMAATIVVAVGGQVLDSLPQVAWLHPWLFSHHWLSLLDMLRDPITWVSFRDNLAVQLGYLTVFGAAAHGRFVTRDVLG
jgi:ABC-2 type transport system permease protein